MSTEAAIREDRLRRNRISAQKCRIKRKAAVVGLKEEKEGLEQENHQLRIENERLAALVAKLSRGEIYTTPIDTVTATQSTSPEMGSRKRTRYSQESGVRDSLDFSESAEFASPPQMEHILLAVLTTLLCNKRTMGHNSTSISTSTSRRRPDWEEAPRRRTGLQHLATQIIQVLRSHLRSPTSRMDGSEERWGSRMREKRRLFMNRLTYQNLPPSLLPRTASIGNPQHAVMAAA